MGHCSCGAHSCAAEKKVDAKVSVFHEYGKVIFSLLLLAGGIIMNALDLAFFREGYVSLICAYRACPTVLLQLRLQTAPSSE